MQTHTHTQTHAHTHTHTNVHAHKGAYTAKTEATSASIMLFNDHNSIEDMEPTSL